MSDSTSPSFISGKSEQIIKTDISTTAVANQDSATRLKMQKSDSCRKKSSWDNLKSILNRLIIAISPFRTFQVHSLGDLNSFKHRKHLVLRRLWYINNSAFFVITSIILTLLMADIQLQHFYRGDSMPKDLNRLLGNAEESLVIGFDQNFMGRTQNYFDKWEGCSNLTDTEQYETILSDPKRASALMFECVHKIYNPGALVLFLNCILVVCNLTLVFYSFMYYKIEYQLYKFDNSISPELPYVRWSWWTRLVIEMIVIFATPIAWNPSRYFHGHSAADFDFLDKNSNTGVYIEMKSGNFLANPFIYYIVLFRFLLLGRFFLLQSSLFGNVTAESVATFNQINFGSVSGELYRLVFRHFMNKYASEVTCGLVAVIWAFLAWAIRLAEGHHAVTAFKMDDISFSYPEMAWLVPITMTTIGYGDLYPKSGAGKVFILLIGFFGLIASAVLVGIVCDKLTMSRREKMIHEILDRNQNKKDLRDAAATVLQRCWLRHKEGYNILQRATKYDASIKKGRATKKMDNNNNEPGRQINPQKKTYVPLIRTVRILKAIEKFRKLRVTIKYEANDYIDLQDIGIQQDTIEEKVKKIEKSMETRMDKIEGKIDMLISHMQTKVEVISCNTNQM